MKKYTLILLITLGYFATGCTFKEGADYFFEGPAPKAGASADDSPATSPADILGYVLAAIGGPLGIAGAAGLRVARRANRAKNALLDANAAAIESGELSKANTKESVKIVLKTAQESQDDSALIREGYLKWKAKRGKN